MELGFLSLQAENKDIFLNLHMPVEPSSNEVPFLLHAEVVFPET